MRENGEGRKVEEGVARLLRLGIRGVSALMLVRYPWVSVGIRGYPRWAAAGSQESPRMHCGCITHVLHDVLALSGPQRGRHKHQKTCRADP